MSSAIPGAIGVSRLMAGMPSRTIPRAAQAGEIALSSAEQHFLSGDRVAQVEGDGKGAKFLDGGEGIFGDENGNNTHCKVCGSLLYSVVRDGAFVHVAMGTLVDDPTIRPTKHIFVGSKAPWFTITDDLPQYEAHAVAAGPAGGR